MENDTTATNNAAAATNATTKLVSGGVKSNNHINEEEHSNLNSEENIPEKMEEKEEDENEEEQQQPTGSETTAQQPSRTPFTNLSQVDADLALARTLQEQLFSSDEAYARALQEAEEREMAARLLALAGIHDQDTEDMEEHGANSQDAWEDVDPDELSYEELLALGEVVGTESRGLSNDTLACLPSVIYKTGSDQHGSNDSCVICRVDYEDDESLTILSCKHLYHPECINNWLKINKVCPVCSTEVSTSGSNL
ncbi:hypothetical protein TSUD_51820 [Trifolium subterraneum]|uniref:RING-type domain-containing protein n=1 Tax=Trifolium subterraneum TaxID=3900 RepID=A0A2Z6LP41_TRISU|nr:hypothetical protein TSUD_51820 [Trifolium subterraneum]